MDIHLPNNCEKCGDRTTAYDVTRVVLCICGKCASKLGITWLNKYAPQAFIIFNPSTTTPPVTDSPAHSGDKMAWCWPATTSPNNDWLISPPPGAV